MTPQHDAHPFLATSDPIQWSTLRPEAVEPDIRRALQDAAARVDHIAAQSPPYTYDNTVAALDEALEPLERAWGLVGHLDSVCNSPELRKAYNAMLPDVSRFFSGIPLNEALWSSLKAYGESGALRELAPARQRHVVETLADFREQGADLPPPQKERAAAIQSKLAALTQKYSENCLDATNAWEKIVTDERQLAGLPDSARAAARQSAAQKGYEDAWRFTLQAPSYIPVMTYADDDALRREIWEAYAAIGREAPHGNCDLVREILELRQEFAELVGKPHFADLVTERRMVGSGRAALDFTYGIHAKVADRFREEAEQLRRFKAETLGTEPELLEPWEAAYWGEKQRRANYDFDEEALRPYFPIDRVISGMFELAEQLFGLSITEGTGAETWHDEVTFYELKDAGSGELLGAFYADWHPRESKRGGAWFNPLVTGERARDTSRSPHLGVICGNLTPSIDGKPACLTHREVETIFHEFGHLLHHLCGEVEVKSLNGVNVPWDFVELPSQLMENWCWERESLDRFARHHETGEPIPDDLFRKMLAARNHMKASATIRQLSFGKMDLELHMNWSRCGKPELDDFIEEKLADYKATYKTEPRSNVFNFSHLFSSPTGYAAGYYSYKWAEVLDADAFTRFQDEGVLNGQTGRDFRARILAKGNSEPPAQLFEAFTGRAPDPDALLRRDGLLP